MPDIDIERLATSMEPSEIFVRDLRGALGEHWRGETAVTTSPRRLLRRWLAAAGVVAVVVGVVAAVRRDDGVPSISPTTTPTTALLDGWERVATIHFDEATEASIGIDGTLALTKRGEQWWLGTYTAEGLIIERPIDDVELPPGVIYRSRGDVVIGTRAYTVVSNRWKHTADAMPASGPDPTIERIGSQWVIRTDLTTWSIDVPADSDGSEPTLVPGFRGAGYGLLISTTGGSSIVGALPPLKAAATERIEGDWTAVAASDGGLLVRRVDETKRDYSVDRVPWPTNALDPADVVDIRWNVDYFGFQPFGQWGIWYEFHADGSITGNDGCADYRVDAPAWRIEGSAIVATHPIPQVGRCPEWLYAPFGEASVTDGGTRLTITQESEGSDVSASSG